MASRGTSALLVALMVAPAILALAASPGAAAPVPAAVPLAPDATYPLGLPDPFDYTDVVLLGNNNSQLSRNLTAHFQQVRNVPANNVILADLPVGESISEAQWNTFAPWFEGEMANRSLGADINYIVTFKDIPIRVYWTTPGGPTSFQDALMLLGGSYEGYIGNANLYPNAFFNHSERFTFAQFGLRLVTGIYAYNESTAMALIDRAANSLGSRGEFVLDADASKGFSGGHGTYAYANAALVWANATLAADGWPTYLDANNTYVTGRSGVMGYSSWGSNDCCWGSVTQVALPHNTWVNGSIGETFVSTGARSFTWPPSYGQSLIADWIDEGANAMKGYTDEPYINAIADGHILHVHYTRGYNMAESYWAASHFVGWRQIVIGDPKMAAYADIGDLSINGTLTSVPATALQGGAVNLTLGLDSRAPSPLVAAVQVEVGGIAVANFTAALAARSSSSFQLSLSLAGLPATAWGAQGLTVALDAAGAIAERNESNNNRAFAFEVQRAPIVDGALAAGTVLSGEDVVLNLSALRADRPLSTFTIRVIGGGAPSNLPATANAATFTIAFPRSGAYQLEVVAVDTGGVASIARVFNVTVLDRAPFAAFGANTTTPLSGESVHLDANQSADPDGNITSYAWTVAGAANGTGATLVVVFPRPGAYTVELTVTDDEGATGTASVIISVRNRAPTAALATNVSAVLTLVPVMFSAVGSEDPDGTIDSYTFEFDDGGEHLGSSPTAEHTYNTAGTWGAWLTVTDDWGASTRARVVVEVGNRAPVVEWAGPFEGPTAESVPVVFVAYARDDDGTLAAFTLDFGDGKRVNRGVTGRLWDVNESHTYTATGNFAVTLSFTDDMGASTVLSVLLPVIHPAPSLNVPTVGVVGGNFSVSYAGESPYGNLELVVERNGSIWRQVGIDGPGTLSIPLTGLSPGTYNFEVYVTDGTARSEGVLGTFVVNETSSPPPPPPPPFHEGGEGETAPVIEIAIGAVIVAGALAWTLWYMRKHR